MQAWCLLVGTWEVLDFWEENKKLCGLSILHGVGVQEAFFLDISSASSWSKAGSEWEGFLPFIEVDGETTPKFKEAM